MFALNFLLRRIVQGIVIIGLVTLLIFTLLRIVPGDPVRTMLGPMVAPSVMEQVATELGLRDPIPVQFGRYMLQVMKGTSVTPSFAMRRAAAPGVARRRNLRRPEPCQGLGIDRQHHSLQHSPRRTRYHLHSAHLLSHRLHRRPLLGKWPDRLSLYASSVLVSLPNVWLGIVLILLLSAWVGSCPPLATRDRAMQSCPHWCWRLNSLPS